MPAQPAPLSFAVSPPSARAWASLVLLGGVLPLREGGQLLLSLERPQALLEALRAAA